MTTERPYWNPELETMSLSELRKLQFSRLKQLLEWAYERSPFYRQRFDTAGLRPADIDTLDAYSAQVPFISKEIILEAQQANPPYGGLLTVPTADLARIIVSGGPLYMPFTAEDFDGMTDMQVTAMWCAGIRSSDIADVTANYHWVAAGSNLDASYRKIGCAVIPGGVGNTNIRLEAMQKLGVTTTFGFPTYFAHLAQEAKAMGLDLRKDLKLRIAMIGGEMKPKEQLDELEEQYGMKVREIYGTADCGSIAYECDERAGLHLSAHAIVEILDPVTHQPVPEGNGGEVIITPLWRKGIPTIRYKTDDIIAYVSHDPCPCGRTTPRLGPVVGRVGDIARVKGMFIVPKQIENALYSFKGLGRFQMVITRPQLYDVLTLRIEAAKEVDRAGIKTLVAKALNESIRVSPEVEFVDEGALGGDAPAVVDNRKAQAPVRS